MYLLIDLRFKQTRSITKEEFIEYIFDESYTVYENEDSTTWFGEDGIVVTHIKESNIDFISLGKEVAALVDVNAHGKAYETITAALGYTDLEEKFQNINYHHERIGHLTDIQIAKRYTAYKELIKRGKLDHGKSFIQHIYNNL